MLLSMFSAPLAPSARLGSGWRRAAAACRRFWGDEGGSVLVDYVALTAVMTAAGVYAEHKVGVRVAEMMQAIADALPG